MHPGRADVIDAGALILSRVLRRTPRRHPGRLRGRHPRRHRLVDGRVSGSHDLARPFDVGTTGLAHGTAVMNDQTTRTTDEPLGALVHRLTEQIPELVRSEMRLAQAELTQKGKKAGLGIGMFSAAGLLAFFGLATLITTAILALALVVPAWAAALIVAAVLLAIAGRRGLARQEGGRAGDPARAGADDRERQGGRRRREGRPRMNAHRANGTTPGAARGRHRPPARRAGLDRRRPARKAGREDPGQGQGRRAARPATTDTASRSRRCWPVPLPRSRRSGGSSPSDPPFPLTSRRSTP